MARRSVQGPKILPEPVSQLDLQPWLYAFICLPRALLRCNGRALEWLSEGCKATVS